MEQSESLIAGLVALFFFGSLLALIVGYIVLQRKRMGNLRALAESMGFSFEPGGDAAFLKSLQHFHLFSQGHSRKIRNLMQGQVEEIDVAVFDYAYNPFGKKRVQQQTVALLESGDLQLPAFSLRPEGMLHRLGRLVGYQDIDLEAYPIFSRQYVVQGEDEGQVRSILSAEVIAHYEALEGMSTEGAGNQLVYYRASKRAPVEGVEQLMEEGLQAAKMLRRAS